jgi:nitrite reductase (NADH) large subunit
MQGLSFAQPPLKDQTIILPDGRQLAELERVVTELGARVYKFRLTDARSGSRTVERWLAELVEGEYDDVVFATAQGVHLLSEFAGALGKDRELVSALKAVRVITLGAKPARALAELGVPVAVKAPARSTDGLLATLPQLKLEGHVVGLQHWGPDLDPRVSEYLESVGAQPRLVSNAPIGDHTADELLNWLVNGRDVSIVFTSVTQVTWLFEAAAVAGRQAELRDALKAIRVVATESVADALRSQSVSVIPVPSRSLVILPRGPNIAEMFSASFSSRARASASPPETAATGRTQPGDKDWMNQGNRRRVVVIGNGMVGFRFCEKMREYDTAGRYELVTFCEEPRPAYDRVQLTKFFETRDPETLSLAGSEWYARHGVQLLLGKRAIKLDRRRRVVVANDGMEVPYDLAILATGSVPFVPPVPGMDKIGVFVYRTIEDLEAIVQYSSKCKRAAVMGGGLLGLEAAKAVSELGLDTHVVEFAPRLMPRQLDNAGARVLSRKIEELGVKVHVGRNTTRVLGEDTVSGLRYSDGERLDVDMIVVSAGIRPRDDLARDSGLRVGERGGVLVDDHLRSSDPDVYAIGECALHRGMIYGLVAPGYEMADTVARSLAGQPSEFVGADLSTKLKLLGIDVASFGDALLKSERSIVYEDLVKGVYKKLVLSDDGERLLGGSLVGDAGEYAKLLHLTKSGDKLPEAPESLILGARGGDEFQADLPDAMQVCSCNNVTKGDICHAVKELGATDMGQLKGCTKAGTGCGGCVPLVTDLLNNELRALGKAVKPRLCEHFNHTRQELYHIIKVKGFHTFEEVIKHCGSGDGCEICKPTVASILASVVNELIVKHDYLQDTNDRFLANIQRQGLYSVVPRVPGGEITPDKLIALGEVAKKYGLYTKITGGQRVDLFGARLNQLPNIWEDLINAGFESGHAYGKALRTVKSCVGSTWCRYGVQDSVGMAIRLENRYKGIRSPHKLKSAVSGCVRECAEARSKDFSLIATEKGYNVYVCGNGGANPRHADLLVSDVSEADAIRYIDRFLMYYISTADKLTRTSVWLEKLDGGLDQLRSVIVNDSLGIVEDLERDMQHLIDTYQCEWRSVVEDPKLREKFRHYANSDDGDDHVTLVAERDSQRPADWGKEEPPPEPVRLPMFRGSWVRVASVADFPENAGMTVKYGNTQIAVFNFSSRGEWYAVQNQCPHKKDMVLSRGIIGDHAGAPKVACPLHKKTFSLEDGKCLTGENYRVATFPVKIVGQDVMVELPSIEEVERLLGSDRLVRSKRRLQAVPAAE